MKPTLKELHDAEQREARHMAQLDALIDTWAKDEARDKRFMMVVTWICGFAAIVVAFLIKWLS